MKHGTYTGPEAGLKGEKALIISNPDRPGWVKAQFDRLDLERDGTNLAHGWHEFPAANFEEDPAE